MVDVSEIVSYKHKQEIKKFENEGDKLSAKKVKFDVELADSAQPPSDQIENDDIEDFDENTLKKLLLLFEKRIYKNQELRIKFADNPEKFLDSELNLHDVVHEMHVISTAPHLYYILVELGSVNSLVTLLSHENTDIAIAVVDLIQEMTDVSISEGLEDQTSMDSYLTFIDSLFVAQIIPIIVQNMDRLDETIKEESTGVFNSLAIIENLSEIYPKICIEGTQQELLTWILKRLKLKIPFDSNKLYATEILAIFLQNNDGNRAFIGTSGGIDLLLRHLAFYKRHDPQTGEEFEYMSNLFDCLSLCLMDIENRHKFLQGEGLQLMNLMLREKKQSRIGAIKILNHALLFTNVSGSETQTLKQEKDASNPESGETTHKLQNRTAEVVKECCNKFVEILGLRTIFPLFMKTPVFMVFEPAHFNNPVVDKRKNKIRSVGMSKTEAEEHIISIVASLARSCTNEPRERFMAKFVENNLSKVDRLVELHFNYLNKVVKSDREIELMKQRLVDENVEDTEAMEEEFYLRRLENGLFTLQMIDYVMMEICHEDKLRHKHHSKISGRIHELLGLRKGSTVQAIKDILLEYATNLGEEGENNEIQANFRQHLNELIKNF